MGWKIQKDGSPMMDQDEELLPSETPAEEGHPQNPKGRGVSGQVWQSPSQRQHKQQPCKDAKRQRESNREGGCERVKVQIQRVLAP